MSAHFKLQPECYLVLGKTRSLIQNLVTEEIIWLDEENTELLIRAESGADIDPQTALFAELTQSGWGFFPERNVYIDKIRPTNAFSQKRMWKDTPVLLHATIQLTNECNQNCEFCKDTFCPTCTVFDTERGRNLSKEQWFGIIDELHYFGVQTILFTGGEIALYEYLEDLASYVLTKGLGLGLHTNGIIPLKGFGNNVPKVITVTHQKNIEKILKNYHNFTNISLVNLCPEKEYINSKVKGRWPVVHSDIHQPVIVKNSMVKTGMQRFFSRKLANHCLNHKIFIAHDGTVLPCFGDRETIVSDLTQTNLSDTIRELSENYWNIAVDSVDRKCKHCEFRYACISCSRLDVERQCTYDLEEATWISK